MSNEKLLNNFENAKRFNIWLNKKGFTKESEERYTISRQYLYEVYLNEIYN